MRGLAAGAVILVSFVAAGCGSDSEGTGQQEQEQKPGHNVRRPR